MSLIILRLRRLTFPILSSSMVSLRSLLLVLMSPSTHATFGLVSCPSGDVSDLLLSSHTCIKLSDLFQIFRRRFPPIFWTHRFSRGSISPTWSHHRSLSTRLMPSSFTTLNRTLSPQLSKVLRKWDEERWDAPERRQKLAWVLLVELLSYQFVSSVR